MIEINRFKYDQVYLTGTSYNVWHAQINMTEDMCYTVYDCVLHNLQRTKLDLEV